MTLEESRFELGVTGLEGLAQNYLNTLRVVHEYNFSDSLTTSGLKVQVTREAIDLVQQFYKVTQENLPKEEYPNLMRLADKMYNELERVLVMKD